MQVPGRLSRPASGLGARGSGLGRALCYVVGASSPRWAVLLRGCPRSAHIPAPLAPRDPAMASVTGGEYENWGALSGS